MSITSPASSTTRYHDVFTAMMYPKGVQVSFKGLNATDGNQAKPSQAREAPTISWPEPDKGWFYTLAMVDPDAPSKDDPKYREWRHWLVINIPGDDIHRGDVLTPYAGPAPPKGTGFHRYVILVYKQPNRIMAESMNNEGTGRASFKIEQWAQRHNLGTPIAVNYFLSQAE